VEQIFSRAGGLTDPNIDQDYLATLVVFLVGCKNKAFKPSCDAINAKYYQLFRGKGGKGLEEDCEEDKEEADEAPRPGGGSCRDSTRTQDLELRI
jgi:hypothetical protein